MDDQLLEHAALGALGGKWAHVGPLQALESLDWKAAGTRAGEAPHTVFQVLEHMIYWLDFFLEWTRGPRPPFPSSAAEGWAAPPAPASEEQWKESLERLAGRLEQLETLARGELSRPVQKSTLLAVLLAAASHNSYHLGQIVQLRRMLNTWPPPGGGDTW